MKATCLGRQISAVGVNQSQLEKLCHVSFGRILVNFMVGGRKALAAAESVADLHLVLVVEKLFLPLVPVHLASVRPLFQVLEKKTCTLSKPEPKRTLNTLSLQATDKSFRQPRPQRQHWSLVLWFRVLRTRVFERERIPIW